MGDEKEKEETVEVTLKLKKRLWNRISAQVDFLNEIKMPELSCVTSPEDLLLFYVEQLSMPDNQLSEVSEKIGEVLKLFSKRGINMRNLLNSFTHQQEPQEPKAKQGVDEDDIDWEVED